MVKDRIVVWETLESLKKKLEAEDDDEPPTLRHLLKDATLVIQLYGDDRGTFYSHRIETDDFATKLVVEFDNLLKWSAVGQENIRHCAAGALLVFIGHLATVKNEVLIVNLSPSFRYFMVGIVASLIAQIVTWVSYWTFSQTLTKHCSKWCRWIVGFLIIVSIIAFVGGGILSYNALQAQAKIPASPRGLTIQ